MMKKPTVQNEIRDIINWISVFKEEYELEEEVVDKLRGRLEKLSQMVDEL